MSLDRYRTNPQAFIDDFIPCNEKGQPWRLSAHQRKVMALTFRWNAEGRLDLLRMLLWGETKKSGKTLLAAALGLWWSYTRPYSETVLIANDHEQSIGRVFKTMVALIRHNPSLAQSATIRSASILLSNGHEIWAISSDYTGEAGRRHSLAIFDEPWGIMSERAHRLFEELTPPPTEPEAWVLMVTYAGFTGESTLLENLYNAGLQGERIDDELEVYRAGSLTMFWSHTPRQPWQTEQYYAEQRQTLRPNAFRRLHQNEWVTGTEAFITEAEWDACTDSRATPQLFGGDGAEAVIGVDAGIKHDNAARVVVTWNGERVILLSHRLWKPTPEQPLDLEATIERDLIECQHRWNVRAIVCDPFQMHRSITTLRKAGLPIRELPQTVGNVTAFGQSLFDVIRGRNLVIYPAADLREQALNAVAVETGRGWRLAKEKTSKKIDAIVALAMAVHTAIEEGGRSRECLAVIPAQNAHTQRSRTSQALQDLRAEHAAREAAALSFDAEIRAHNASLLRLEREARIRANVERFGAEVALALDPTAADVITRLTGAGAA